MENSEEIISRNIATQLKALRLARAMTIEDLADLSGVSRAMISRIERAQASPTAALLARLCSALGLSLSAFFEETETAGAPLARRETQALWRDPQTGYRRRSVSPPGTGARVDVVEVEFPPGATVRFAAQPASRNQWQHVWLFEGEMELAVDEETYRLHPGDCLHMNIGDVHSFHNPTAMPARYAVIIDLGGR